MHHLKIRKENFHLRSGNIFPVNYPQLPRTAMEVFKSLPEGVRAQLIGNLIVTEPASTYSHQDVLRGIFLSMANFIETRNLGKNLFAPLDVYLDEKNVFQPDILFVAAERAHLIRPNGFYGAPDLVVEVLSRSTAKYDRGNKKAITNLPPKNHAFAL